MSTQIKGQEKQIRNDNIQASVASSHRKTTIKLENGKSAITMNGGLLYPLLYKEILAGEYIREWKIDNLTRLITPFVPTMDKVKLSIDAYFVPNTRVMKNWNELITDKDDASSQELNRELPTFTTAPELTQNFNFKNTLMARYGVPNNGGVSKINMLLLRGYRAIENDFIRNKQYEPKKVEWNGRTLSTSEEEAVAAFGGTTDPEPKTPNAYIIAPAQTTKNYYTNIMKNLAKDQEKMQAQLEQAEHLDWQTRYQNEKQKAENANKNDWDIIAEMGGTAPIRTDQVEHLGNITYDLNYQQITQSSNEANAPTPLGTTGSFSYTRANGTIFHHKHFKQHGYIHILASVVLEKAPENGIPKELLKTSIDDIYRPALAKKEIQLLLEQEIDATLGSTSGKGAAYQPAWAEYKRLPNLVSGEMRSQTLKGDSTLGIPNGISNAHWHNFQRQYAADRTITGKWFRDTKKVNEVLARNNVINHGVIEFDETWDDLIMNMSEHYVKVSLPIEENDLKQKRKAEVAR